MSVFEFLLALYAIIAGIGVSLLVRSIGQMIEARDRVRLYWVHTTWLALIFVVHVVTWFALWRFHDHSPWTVWQALLLLAMPILLYLVSHLAVPELEDDAVHDMRQYYFRQCGWIQGLMLGVIASGTAAQIGIEGGPDASGPGVLRVAAALVLLPGVFTRRPMVHATQSVLLLAIVALGVSFLSKPIG
jgi:hypothetical protein